MNMDQTTEFFRKAINILMASNPQGTSLGILFGVIFDGLLGLFSPFLDGIKAINIAAVKLWHLIGLGVVITNLPSFLKRKKVDDSIIEAINYIEKQKAKGNIADWQARLMYANLHDKVLQGVMNSGESAATVRKVKEIISYTTKTTSKSNI